MCFWCPTNAKKRAGIRFCSGFFCINVVVWSNKSTLSLHQQHLWFIAQTTPPSRPAPSVLPRPLWLVSSMTSWHTQRTEEAELKTSFFCHLICSLSFPRSSANPLRILSSSASSRILISNSTRLEWLYLLTRPPSHPHPTTEALSL